MGGRWGFGLRQQDVLLQKSEFFCNGDSPCARSIAVTKPDTAVIPLYSWEDVAGGAGTVPQPRLLREGSETPRVLLRPADRCPPKLSPPPLTCFSVIFLSPGKFQL